MEKSCQLGGTNTLAYCGSATTETKGKVWWLWLKTIEKKEEEEEIGFQFVFAEKTSGGEKKIGGDGDVIDGVTSDEVIDDTSVSDVIGSADDGGDGPEDDLAVEQDERGGKMWVHQTFNLVMLWHGMSRYVTLCHVM
jgi:hypothetical protein